MSLKLQLIIGLVLSILLIGLALFLRPEDFSANLINEMKSEKVTYVISLNDDVFVNGEKVSKKSEIKKGDIIKTSEKGKAEIIFPDDSVSRLSSSTEIVIDLVEYDLKNHESNVRIKAVKGQIWSKIIKLISFKSKFEVKTETVVAAVRGTAFNVEVSENGSAKIIAFEHPITISAINPETKQTVDEIIVREGDKADIGATTVFEGEKATFIKVLVADAELISKWAEENKKDDVLYEADVIKEDIKTRKDLVSSLPGTYWYNILVENDIKRLKNASTEFEKVQIISEISERKLVEALVLLDEGKSDLASKNIKEYKDLLEKLLELNVGAVSDKISESVARQKLLLRSVKIDDENFYNVRKIVEEIELDAASEEVKDAIHSFQVERKLIEISDVIKKGSTDKISNEIKEVMKEVQEVKINSEIINNETLETLETVSGQKIPEQKQINENNNSVTETSLEVKTSETQVDNATTDPTIKTDDPNAATTDPTVKTDDPNAATTDPTVKTDDPNAATTDPTVKTDDPNAATTDPTAKTDDPNATTTPITEDKLKNGDLSTNSTDYANMSYEERMKMLQGNIEGKNGADILGEDLAEVENDSEN